MNQVKTLTIHQLPSYFYNKISTMKTLEVQLSEAIVSKLQEAAERLHITPQELMILSLEEKLSQLEVEFQQAKNYVLNNHP